ncbi:hypothetical protein H5P28_17150 [Ruficoccus amylovorans]|uniref:Uncharacterized protein n=1 Tax=Ruficoccus amylovorans TaxID=1804625 RepID=A0A842HKD0_9BACT|nr:hypothetical protein [Ruficoccus amylovorans]MBC2595996.1 hypothetical protein [Ruficoccus amylovorans]
MPEFVDASKAPSGSYTMINLSNQDVAVKLNEENFLLKSRSAKNIEPQGEKRYDSLSVATGDAQDFTIVSDVNLPRPKSSRYLVFVQDESEEGGVGLDVVSF